MSIKKTLSLAAVALAALAFSPAWAHGGGEAKHGGVVQTSNDLAFELVAQADGAAIYVEDHGKPMALAGMSGKLTVLSGSDKAEAPLVVAGDKLLASGIKLVKGAKVVAALSAAGGKAMTVRFTVK